MALYGVVPESRNQQIVGENDVEKRMFRAGHPSVGVYPADLGSP
jgi:hypothetical protein